MNERTSQPTIPASIQEETKFFLKLLYSLGRYPSEISWSVDNYGLYWITFK